MRRIAAAPRPDWRAQLEAIDFHGWRHADGAPYWVEDACYELSEAEVETLYEAALAVESAVAAALGARMQDPQRLEALGLAPDLALCAMRTWERRDPSLYGRFDFAWNGREPPKLLEYNADTPTALYECAVVQWRWLVDRDAEGDQFNSLHERLVARFGELSAPIRRGGRLTLAGLLDEPDDAMTLRYLAECATQAETPWRLLDIREVGLKDGALVDLQDEPITHLFKLYPWEWMAEEDPAFFAALTGPDIGVLEPAWRAAASSKLLLADLWAQNPGHPNLAPASLDPADLAGDIVSKPAFGREGANVRLFGGGRAEVAALGPFAHQPHVHQARLDLGPRDGFYPVFGVWSVGGEPCGLGVREDVSPITGPAARFAPHRIV